MLLLLTTLALAQSAPATPAPAATPATPAPAATPAAPPTAPAAPSVPRLAKMEVGTSGFALYAPPGLSFGAPEKSQDGADVWISDVRVDAWTYGAVVVKFNGMDPAAPGDELESMLIGYLEFLRGQLGITATVGVGRGHTLESAPAARGVIDIWQDAEGDTWQVKAWVEPRGLAVLFIAGKGDYPWFNLQQMYLNGFRYSAS